MRYKIGEHGIGGRNETWYYVEFDESTGQAFWVREWDNLNHRLQTNEGKERVELREASGKSFYEEAMRVITEKHPDWVGNPAQ